MEANDRKLWRNLYFEFCDVGLTNLAYLCAADQTFMTFTHAKDNIAYAILVDKDRDVVDGLHEFLLPRRPQLHISTDQA